ncbi:MAG: UDP-N-acetylglucosamine--N-acetylmuramyl-(pentapeptide) pyrophosphoryl-undecaprenol N-acetylglucosamine transferase, partial [Planctomycetota bacterium]|nr:UDP-N-acetylglucosamine--N-acetylmuramyl-(pentapeptide) pyrophosphoryl-undecaprenol N-acetylglucosamine transferase [Planctomycetota bacterium]
FFSTLRGTPMTRSLLIAGGGTGGHLFPGIAVAQEIHRRLPALEVQFACTNRELDGAELAKYGFAARPLSTPRWGGSLPGLPVFALSLLDALVEAAELVRRVRPCAVVGLGGYGCAPPVFAAWRLGIPTLMLEQNVIPGRATRTLGPFVDSVCCQWAETISALDSPLRRSLCARVRRGRARAGRDRTAGWLLHTGNPLRIEMQRMPVRAARLRFGLENASRVLLVLGGSQGSVALDEIAVRTVPMLREAVPGLGVIHIASARDREKVEKAYAAAGVSASVHGFFRDMPAAYSASDAALCRAGGTTIAELTKFGIPMALIPYPHAMDDHQTANARAVEGAGAGYVFPESRLEPATLFKSLMQLLGDTHVLALMSARSRSMAFPDAAAQVADRLVELRDSDR